MASGLAAVIELSLVPVALLILGVMVGEEAFSPTRAVAVGLGVAGIAILLGPKAYAGTGTSGSATMELLGAAAVALCAFAYAWGSVVARPLLRRSTPTFVSGVTMLAGGGLLLACALIFEPGTAEALAGSWGWSGWAGWLFLVIFGSVVAHTIYLRLLRDWGASRAGAYAFVSPAVAVLLGAAVYGEEVASADLAGMGIMSTAAWLALRARSI